MNQQYRFSYKRNALLPFKTILVMGHQFHPEMDRMDLFLPDGGIFSIPKWNECYLQLGTDWVLATKKRLEQESGQSINLTV